jgi:hypothetical protein
VKTKIQPSATHKANTTAKIDALCRAQQSKAAETEAEGDLREIEEARVKKAEDLLKKIG